VDIHRRANRAVIVPPTETTLAITQESQILTGLISTSLSRLGFSLKQLPFEVLPVNGDGHRPNERGKTVVISTELLKELRERHDLRALVIGNAFFTIDPYGGAPQIRITSAHLKIVDIVTLDLLGQVSLPYQPDGDDLNDAAERIALALGRMAGFAHE
jgi:hypothetical protein